MSGATGKYMEKTMNNNTQLVIGIPDGRDAKETAATGANIPAEMLARGLFSLCQYKDLPPDVVKVLYGQALAGNREAAFFLLDHMESDQLPDSVESAVMDNLVIAIQEGEPFAQGVQGCTLLLSANPRKIRQGLKLVGKAAEGGFAKGLWDASMILADKMPSIAAECALRAASRDLSPAIDALTVANTVLKTREAKFIKEQEASLGALRTDAYGEARQIESELVEYKQRLSEANAKNASLNGQVQEWQKRCEDARARLDSLTADMLRDDMIIQLQAKVNQAEEEWLQAKLESEHAEVVKIKAERKAEDLTRRNKHLTCLLRKKGIPFHEYESSSSSENGESHLGLAN